MSHWQMRGPTSMRCGGLAIWLITWAICISADNRAGLQSPSGPRTSGSQFSAVGTAADRLHVAELFLADTIQNALAHERARVQRMCARDVEVVRCVEHEGRPLSLHFVRVRRAPSFTAPIAGDLIVVGRRSPAEYQFDVVYRAAADGRRRIWLRNIDWGYGPNLSGVRSRDGWIGLAGAPFDGDAWIYLGVTNKLRGEASTIAGQVLELHGVQARSGDGRAPVVASGAYFIIDVDRAGVVSFREELDIDMPCGEDVSPPTVMPPTFRARASELFDARGMPRFAVKYWKGC